jgi:hypothetical protein
VVNGVAVTTVAAVADALDAATASPS